MGAGSLGGILTGAGNPSTPGGRSAGNIYGNLLNSYLGNQGNIYNTAATYQPAYAALAAGTLSSLAPGAASTVMGVNPSQTNLLGQLAGTASSQLAAGTNLTPGQTFTAQQQLRGSEAARGLGYSPGDAFSEALNMTNLGQQMLQQREGFAGNVAGQQFQTQTNPILSLLSGLVGTTAPGIISPNIQSGLLLAPYGAQEESALQASKNNTSLYQSLDQNSTSFLSNLLSTSGPFGF